jgi:hypothetical protein
MRNSIVAKFREANKVLDKIIKQEGFESPAFEKTWDKMTDIVSVIKEILGNEAVLQIPDIGLKRALTDIRDNKGFTFFKIYELFGIDPEIRPLNYEEIREDLHEQIHDQILPNEIIRGRMEVGTIVLSQFVPPFFQYHLEKIRDCYCFNFPEAASIWCRSLLEVALKEALKRRGKIRSNSKVLYMDEIKLKDLINMCRGLFEQSLIDKMKYVQREVNLILHSEDISRREKINHLNIIKATFQVIEHAFE